MRNIKDINVLDWQGAASVRTIDGDRAKQVRVREEIVIRLSELEIQVGPKLAKVEKLTLEVNWHRKAAENARRSDNGAYMKLEAVRRYGELVEELHTELSDVEE